MSNWNLTADAAFDRLPSPILGIKDNQIIYRNPAAVQALPLLIREAVLPDELCQLKADQSTVLQLENRQWSILRWQAGEMDFIRLESTGDSHILPDYRIPQFTRQLRSPLSALLYCSESIEAAISQNRPEHAQAAIVRERKAQMRLLRMIRSLELAALPDGEAPYDFHPQVVDLSGLLQSTLRQLETPLKSAGCHLEWRNHTRNLCARCDDVLIQTMIYHLVSNAVRSAGQGGTIVLCLERRKDMAFFSVEDDGPGISPQALSSLFSPSEGGTTLSDPFHGLGLGITVCRKIALLHGGSVLLSNLPQRGVRATFSLPLCPPGAPMVLRSPRLADSSNSLPLVLRELSDVLPEQCFRLE
ncbi:MAG: hypothetical protein IJD21_09770 [Oscillospiraceae bacterium]|nr:hypothetical protein [Oscillospiraceae bacterium]